MRRTFVWLVVLSVGIVLGAAHAGLAQYTGASLIDVPGAVGTYAFGINDAGEIVGYYQAPDDRWHGFSRMGVGGTVTTFDAPEAAATYAHGVNAAGVIVGHFVDAAKNTHGYLRNPDGTFVTIDVAGAEDHARVRHQQGRRDRRLLRGRGGQDPRVRADPGRRR